VCPCQSRCRAPAGRATWASAPSVGCGCRGTHAYQPPARPPASQPATQHRSTTCQLSTRQLSAHLVPDDRQAQGHKGIQQEVHVHPPAQQQAPRRRVALQERGGRGWAGGGQRGRTPAPPPTPDLTKSSHSSPRVHPPTHPRTRAPTLPHLAPQQPTWKSQSSPISALSCSGT
jgi:hypothetical protein